MKKTLVLIAVVGALVFALGFAGASFAKSADVVGVLSGVDSPWGSFQQGITGTEETETSQAFRHGRGGRFGDALRSYLEAAIADAFGITVEELEANKEAGVTLTDLAIEQGLTVAEFESKMEAARTAAIDAALAAGDITQEQADEMKARIAEGKTNGKGPKGDSPIHEYIQSALAEAFGVTVEELQALQDEGLTLKDLAIEQNLTVEAFQEKMETARTTAIDNALADGVITKEQAEWLREHKPGSHPGGHPGGRPGGRPGKPGGWFTPGETTPPADSGTSTNG